MPGYDPYLELLGIAPDRRPPSRRELLGVGPDENDVEKIEEATRKRREHLHKYVLSPEEEVAAHARRLLHEVADALVALRNLLTSERPHEEAKAPAEAAMPPPLPPAVPVPPPVVTVATGIPPPVEQGNVVSVAAAAVAEGASPVPVGELVFEEVAAPEGGEPLDLGETAIPLPWKGGLARTGRLLRQTGELLRRMAAGVRSIPRRLWGIVRRADGLLRSIAGEENTILHGFLRAVAIAVLVPALAYAGLWLFWGLANVKATIAARGEGEASPGSGTVRIEATPPPEVAAPKTGNEPPPAIAPFDEAKAQEHQRAWSKHLGVPAEEANSIGMKMVLIPAGEFTLGSYDSADEKPPHRVRITKPFHLGQHEVTVGQFRKFVADSKYDASTRWQNAFSGQTDDHPVVNVSWNDAKAFCDWLSKKEAHGYRLPTEAEWEYACRAGTQTKYGFGDDPGGLGEYGWFGGNSQLQTHPVGQKKPNAWGLYDVYGNVWEWCADWYDSAYYGDVGQVGNLPHAPADDPVGPSSGADRAIRGGAWGCFATTNRSARRSGDQPGARRHDLGFRVARDVTPSPFPARPAEIGRVQIVLSDPTAKVEVKVDGNVIGPAALKGPITLAAGRHRLEVTSEEFDDHTSSFAVRAGTQEVLPVALKPKPPPPAVTGTVRIELSEPQAQLQVKVDGNPVDSAKLDEGLVLPAGDHRLEVTSGQSEGYTSSFTVRAGRQEVLRIPRTPKLPLGPPLAAAPFDAAQARRHRESWGRHLGVPVETANSAGMKFVLIPAGEFLMGSSDGDSNERPPHKVRITKPFYLGQYEVTVGQFRQFVSESGYADWNDRWETAFPSQTDNHPVVGVSWDAAKAFCDWLSKKEHKEYRLPTEAEWEYACRAGSVGKYCFGDDEAALGEYAWHSGDSGSQTHVVGQKKPNAWALHDMHGNAREWCADWYGSDYYGSSPTDDPKGPSSGAFPLLRVVRGGSWSSAARLSRSAHRTADSQDCILHFEGFRVARTP